MRWFVTSLIFFLWKFQCYAEKTNRTNTTAVKSRFDLFQNDYDVILERAEFPTYNRSYIKYRHGEFAPYNRTQRVLNYTCETIKDIENLRLDIQVYKFMSNEYRFFPITVSVNVCMEYELNSFRNKDLLIKYSNMNPCNVKKGVYHIYNGLPDFSKFPPLMPRGRYKVEAKFFEESDFVADADFYGAIKDKKWW